MTKRALPFLILALILGAALYTATSSSAALRAALWAAMIASAVLGVHELMGKPLLFLRWSFIRVGLGARTLLAKWQVGDGREESAARYVLATAPPGNIDAAIAAIDHYAYKESFLINVGDEKGALLDEVIRRTTPKRVLELGTYIGYSALRIARLLRPGGRVYSVEWSDANLEIARRIITHAGAADRITLVHGSLGDDGKTLAALATEHGFAEGKLDVVFLDHDKDAYVADLERILAAGWLRRGSVVVADNVLVPGAPGYREFMAAGEGTRWRTCVHKTHVEYQTVIRDIVLESTLLG